MVQNEFSTLMFPPTPMTDSGYTVEVVTDLKKPPAWHLTISYIRSTHTKVHAFQ